MKEFEINYPEVPYYKLVKNENFNSAKEYIEATKRIKETKTNIENLKQELIKKQSEKKSSLPLVTISMLSIIIITMLLSLIFNLTTIATILSQTKEIDIILLIGLALDIKTYVKNKNTEKSCKRINQDIKKLEEQIEFLKRKKRIYNTNTKRFIRIKNPEKILERKKLNLNQCSLSYNQETTPQIVENEYITYLRKLKENLTNSQPKQSVKSRGQYGRKR